MSIGATRFITITLMTIITAVLYFMRQEQRKRRKNKNGPDLP